MNIPLFLIPVIAGLFVQALKPLLNKEWYATMSPDGHRLPRYGGMPSAHAAFAFATATTVALAEGIGSAAFVIAITLVILILDDALRMRIFLSRHGQALHLLINKLPVKERTEYPYLETRLGHKPLEVFVGGLTGIVVAALLYYSFGTLAL
jgi:acid phosphatase family membrane protein YuiD